MAGGLMLLGALAGCSSMPDELNPRSWFGGGRSAPGASSGVASSGGTSSGTAPGLATRIDASQPFPNLSSVPEPPRPTLDPGQRMAMMRGLESDRQASGRQDAGIRQEMSTVPAQVEDSGSLGGPTSGGFTGRGTLPDSEAPASSPVYDMRPGAALRDPGRAPLPGPASPAEPPPPRSSLTMPSPAASPSSSPSAMAPAAPATAGARYAIPPRPPISPPEPLSAQPGGYLSSQLRETPAMPVQLAAAAAFFAGSDADPGEPVLRVSEAERGPSVSAQVALLTFANGAAGISADQRERLRAVAALRDRLGGRLRVVGHASQRTPDMGVARHKLVNYGLSVDRAYQVADALSRLGVPRRDIAVAARADWDPEAAEAMPSGEAQNRRVEIYLEY